MFLLKFEEIIKESYFDFEKIIKNVEKYLAHLPKEVNLEKETLLSHSNLVLEYSLKLIKHNQIENNIDAVLFNISDNVDFLNSIKLLYIKAIYWHDIGKINENFQLEKMNNSKFLKVDYDISSKHSILSAYLYLVSSFDYINKAFSDINKKIELISISVSFAMTIWRHHTGIYKSINDLICDKDEGLPICSKLDIYLNILNLDINNQMHNHLMNNLVNGDLKNRLKTNENYFLLSKSLFSLLIISDYYATAQFMNFGNVAGLKYNDFGLIDAVFSDKVHNEFYVDKYDIKGTQKTFNQELKDKKNDDFEDFEALYEKSNANLNHLRNKLFIEVRTNLRQNLNQNLFYIEAPTGAGKTNLSLMSVIEILKNDISINKVFYVFPFTTLITQTYDSIKTTLNLNNSQIVQLHSKAKYNDKSESKKDGVYGDSKTNFLDNQFMNYPITLLSHVKFFDILTGVSKDDNYIFHRLANSIVIIDEIQTYNPSMWSSIIYILDSFAKNFNIKFIVMSATLPKIGDIIDSQFVFLVSNKQQYFQNPNFAQRVDIDTKVIKVENPKDIYQRVEKESKSYQKISKTDKVKTIIEFITKKGADEFYQEAKEKNKDKKKFFDTIFILSGTILEPRRKEIIRFLKNTHDQNILLVTTQVVEAGVDIDMDIGFKEKSLVDSDEQLAGRINRNSSKEGNKLYLFEMKNPKAKYVYKGDKRLSVQDDSKVKLDDVLKNKDFDAYYNQVIENIKSINDVSFVENLNSYIDHIKNLRFSETHIKLIEIESISVFVPHNLMAKLYWNAYEKAIRNQEKDLIDKNIDIKKLSAKISKYTFSLAKYQGSGIEYLLPYCKDGKEKYGYLYLEEYQSIYSYEDGLDTKVLKGGNVGMFI